MTKLTLPIVWAGVAEDFPRTAVELERRFADETACRAYLAAPPFESLVTLQATEAG